jgi:hypothetical protein
MSGCPGSRERAKEPQSVIFCTGCTFPQYGSWAMGGMGSTCASCNSMGSACSMCDCNGRCVNCSFGFRQFYNGCISDNSFYAEAGGPPAAAPGPGFETEAAEADPVHEREASPAPGAVAETVATRE